MCAKRSRIEYIEGANLTLFIIIKKIARRVEEEDNTHRGGNKYLLTYSSVYSED